MFRIRRSQVEAFERGAAQDLPERLARLLKESSPTECQRMGGDVGVLEMVRSCIERASTYGMTDERDISIYVFTAAAFGQDFDSLPWAVSALADSNLAMRAERLHVEATERRLRAVGDRK